MAIYGGGGAPYHHLSVFAGADFTVSIVFPREVTLGLLSSFDAFVMPGGGYLAMKGQLDPIGPGGADAIAQFVDRGGMYIGSCAGAYDAATPALGFGESCEAQRHMALSPATVWNEIRSPWSGLLSPGIGRIRVRNDWPGHPVMAGVPDEFDIVHYNGPLFASAHPLFSPIAVGSEFTASESFLHEAAASPSMMDRAIAAGVSAGLVDRFGRGRVVLFGSHPEFGFTMSLDDWSVAAEMLTNAVRWQIAESEPPGIKRAELESELAVDRPESRDELAHELAGIRDSLHTLSGFVPDTPWLERGYAMGLFGRRPKGLWLSSLVRLADLLTEVADHSSALRSNLLGFSQPEAWMLDWGYHGVLSLLVQCHGMLDMAIENWWIAPTAMSEDPYAFEECSPYHLVCSSYLSALGRLTAAAILCRANSRDVNLRPL